MIVKLLPRDVVLFVGAAVLASSLVPVCSAEPAAPNDTIQADVLVYAATPSGVMAAIAAARHGQSVALLDETNHVGGVVSGGLVATDIGDRETVGGLADEFFKRIARFYLTKYGKDSRQVAQCRNGIKFEPHVAEQIFGQMLTEQAKIRVWKRHRIQSVVLDGGQIAALLADDLAKNQPRRFEAKEFIDASYTGDLMALTRVPYRVGRESRQDYGETYAGIRGGPPGVAGAGDHRTQAYNYRVSLTMRKEDRVLFPKPEHYDPQPWRETYGVRIRSRNIERFFDLFTSQDPIAKCQPNDKLDTNWCDLMGGSEGYAEGDWETRKRIEERHRDYFLSLLYYLQNDPELPEKFRADAQNWGLPKDEFVDNGHFPHQIYVRESRRMLGRYVLRESDLTTDRYKPDGICAGSYGIDCHWVQLLLHEGQLIRDQNAGCALRPYDIPYACLTPFEPGNLLVPVCLSTTHVAYCSVRMEPVYMMLGHAAGDAAHLAIAGKTSVQKVDVPQLRKLLEQEGAVLDAGYLPPVQITWTPEHPLPGQPVKFKAAAGKLKAPIKNLWWDVEGSGKATGSGTSLEHTFTLEKVHSVSLLVEDQAGRRRLVEAQVPVGRAMRRDVTLDDEDADRFGRWDRTLPDVKTGPGAHRTSMRGGKPSAARIRFPLSVPWSGRYLVCLGFRPAKDQATAAAIVIRHAEGATRSTVDQRREATPFPFVSLGEFRFRSGNPGYLDVSNADADGRVAIDAVRLVWLGE